jgi:ankyrin repeat protein
MMRWVLSVLGMLAACTTGPRTPLARAAAAGDVKEVERLLRARVAAADDDALIWAARSGAVAAIPLLVAAGANPDATSGVNGWNVLMHAIHKNKIGSVRALLDAKANVNARAGGGTPLSMAAGYGQAEIVSLLLERGAKPDIQSLRYAISGVSDIDNWTTRKCQTETVRLISARDPRLVSSDLLRRVGWKLHRCPELRAALVASPN